MRNPTKQDVFRQVELLSHAAYHLQQSNLDKEGKEGLASVEQAIESFKQSVLMNVVFASTCAEDDETNPGSVRVGVTAHCQCGNTFCGDIRAGYSKSRSPT